MQNLYMTFADKKIWISEGVFSEDTPCLLRKFINRGKEMEIHMVRKYNKKEPDTVFSEKRMGGMQQC